MLTNQGAGDSLLGKSRQSNIQPQKLQINITDQISSKQSKAKSQPVLPTHEKKDKKQERQFTFMLKIFNIVIGLLLAAFGAYCYYGINMNSQPLKFSLIGYILPGYIALSGLIILAIQMHIRIICRNMRFLYNFIGRGLFNIYVGVMPLALLDTSENSKQQSYQKVFIYIIVSLMLFVGLLYIFAKIFCCAKEGDKRKKKQGSSSSSESD